MGPAQSLTRRLLCDEVRLDEREMSGRRMVKGWWWWPAAALIVCCPVSVDRPLPVDNSRRWFLERSVVLLSFRSAPFFPACTLMPHLTRSCGSVPRSYR